MLFSFKTPAAPQRSWASLDVSSIDAAGFEWVRSFTGLLGNWMEISTTAAVVNGDCSLQRMPSVAQQHPHLVEEWSDTALPQQSLPVFISHTLCPDSKLHTNANLYHTAMTDSSAVSHSPVRLWEQRGDPEEASIHQGGRGGIRVRGRAFPSPADASPRQAGPRPALPSALPSALPTAAGEDLQTAERPRPARQPADPCGELQLRAAGPQPKVRNRTLIYQWQWPTVGICLPFLMRLWMLFLNINYLQVVFWPTWVTYSPQ